ncbi:amidinotransferase family protein, partial [Vibrio parahaemolyticus VPTS-2010]
KSSLQAVTATKQSASNGMTRTTC